MSEVLSWYHWLWPLRDAPLVRRPESDIEYNERLFRTGKVGRFMVNEWTDTLRPHPTIKCMFSRPLGEGPTLCYQTHGIQPAIWRRNMAIPYCIRCSVEDPYE